jgi:hypothetical protein
MQWQQLLRIALVLLSLNFSAENFGYLTHQLYQFLGMICLLFYGLSIFPFNKNTERRGYFLAGCLLLIVALFFFRGSILYRLAGTGIYLFSLGFLLQSKEREEREIPLLLFTVTIYFLFFLLYLHSPPFWYGLKEFSLYVSRVVSILTGVPILFAPSFLGIPITFLSLTFILLAFLCSGRKKPAFFVFSLISLLFLSGYYLVLVELLPSLGKSMMGSFSNEDNFVRLFLGFLFEKDYPLTRYNYQMNAPLLLFFICLIPLLLILWKRNVETSSLKPKQGTLRYTLAFLITIALATAALTIDLPGRFSEKKQVVLYNKGFLNWQVPSFRMFGSKSAGMFGNLPHFLEAMGFSTEKVDTISRDGLQDAQILIMINIDREVSQDELKVIWDFVEGGGSLLLLGDHTFYKHGVKRIILNDILEPYSIRYNFDSADWFVGGWLHSYQYASHPVTVGMRDDMNDAGTVIGASLQASPPAFPLVTGKYGYSDPGNELDGGQRGYLGNLNYDQGEPLGDIVLCAAQHYGKGKVMVFGDTSSFANAILVNSHDFVNRVFTWLATDESPKRYRLALFVSLFLLLLGLFFYLKSNRKSSYLLIAVIASLMVVGLAESLKHSGNHKDLEGNIAYVDVSHGERFSPESWNENAVLGLHLNLMRNGYRSFTLRTFEQSRLKGADLLVLIAPSAPFTKKEIGWIKDFVSRGGILILSVGWEEREASLPLMDTFGFAVDYLPLAQFISVIPQANQKVRFAEAWPVISTGEKSEIIAAYQTFPVVMKRFYGKGTVVMIGDSSFFWNRNLEMEESTVRENVEFLKWLLENLKDGSA